jgi:hypothetical protein
VNKYTVYYEDGVEYYITAYKFELYDELVLFKSIKGEILAYFKREPIVAVIKRVSE